MDHELSYVRIGWSLEVVACCQRAVPLVLEGDRDVFRRGLEGLMAGLPRPDTAAERCFLTDRLRVFSREIGEKFHRAFHARTGLPGCPAPLPDDAGGVWPRAGAAADPLALLSEWRCRYETAFERVHPPSGTSRVADFLRSHPSASVSVNDLARMAGCSRAALTRHFREEFGQTVCEFRAHVRVSRAAALLTETPLSIEQVARLVGYNSPKNLYAAFRLCTPLTPGALRHADRALVEELQARAAWPRPAGSLVRPRRPA